MTTRVQGGILARAARNAGILLGGKSAAGAMQLATFAIAARSLGVHDFGLFSILVAQVMTLTGLAAFESNQAIIRYGVRHLNDDDRPSLQALFKAGTALDIVAAMLAALATVAVAPLLGHRLGWNGDLIRLAQWSAPLAFGNAIATPKGMLRLFGRFDLLTVHATVTPAARLVLIAVLGLAGASLPLYIAAWIAAALLGAAVAFLFAWREAHRRALLGGINRSLRGLALTNPGIWGFTLVSNINSTLAMVPTQLAVVIVGAMLGPAAAGLFRVAREAGTGMIKPVDLMSQAIYPDLARLVAGREWTRLARAAVRAGLAAAGVGAVVTGVMLLAGGPIIGLVFGAKFRAAAPLLVAVGASTSIRSLSFAAEPIMYALGRPQLPLAVSIAAATLFLTILIWRLPIDGLTGATVAFIAMGLLGAALAAVLAVRAVAAERRHVES